ncbi:glycoside hydrolase family 13 protein [Microbacterium sp. NPDC076911]|uniref:glycoside hydrolase family 13 protein n=1 Tax=Microbacterium sp. NPDC076911 TaxID=3154958 RepID=UPI00341DE4C0
MLPAVGQLAPNHPHESGWWRTAVIYQIYPRSFADSNDDGMGDLPGITSRLESISQLGADAIWLSPFYRSPQNDGGYDVSDYVDVDPLFGTLSDFDDMIRRAHELGLRVIVDLVPNHCSSAHEWFQQALAAAPGSEERARYLFHDGKGEHGEIPPNNWPSCFGGPAWTRTTNPDGTPGEWYLHIFDTTQPDFDWTNRWVRDRFVEILRFWLDRGVDGFRVDVAHGIAKDPGLPDHLSDPTDVFADTPYYGRDEVHEILREWRTVVDEYDDRILCGEAWVTPHARLANWTRPDEMHQVFNFEYLFTEWDASQLRRVIDASLDAFHAVGAPSTWVLSNHDVVRHATRLAFPLGSDLVAGIGPTTPNLPDTAFALRRGNAATALMLALPGSAYLFQGEELGLPEAIDIPSAARQDPAFITTGGARYGRDGCRVPLPWSNEGSTFGFNQTDAAWLPQPPNWGEYARERQLADPDSTLSLYRKALSLRRDYQLGAGHFSWSAHDGGATISFTTGAVSVLANTGSSPVEPPVGEIILATSRLEDGLVPPDTTVWAVAAHH